MIIMKLRKGIQGPLGKGILIGLFVALFGGIGLANFIGRAFGGGMDGVAQVNGFEISGSRFQRATIDADQQLSMIRQQYGKSADVIMRIQNISINPQETALRNVIQNELVNQVAGKMNITLASEYLEVRLGNPQFILNKIGHLLPSYVFDPKQGVNAQALMEFLKTPQMRGVERELEGELRRQFALFMVQSGFYMPEFMVQSAYKEGHLAKKFSVQTFSLDYFLKKEKAKGATEEQLKSFYDEQNRTAQRYWIPEQRTGIRWTFSPDSYGIKITEKDIEKYYNDFKRTRYVDTPTQFKVREIVFNKLKEQGVSVLKEEAEKARERVVADPSKFAEIAKEVSQNTDTASKGGLVDYFKRGTKDKAYEKAVVRLKADNDVSPVIQLADGGFVVIQRLGRKEASYQPIAKVKDAIIKSLTDQKFRINFGRDADRVVKQANQENLEAFIKDHGGKKEAVGPLERSDQTLGKRLFILKKEGQALSFTLDGKGNILILGKKIAKKLPSLASIKNKIEEDYFEKKATKDLERQMKKAREQALDKDKLVVVDGGKISSTSFIKADDSEKIEKLGKDGYPQGFMGLDWEGAVVSSLNDDGAIVLRLDEIEKTDDKLYKEKKQKLYKQAFERIHQRFASSYIASLYRNATIKVNDQLSQLKDMPL
jgi:hypothetical protein